MHLVQIELMRVKPLQHNAARSCAVRGRTGIQSEYKVNTTMYESDWGFSMQAPDCVRVFMMLGVPGMHEVTKCMLARRAGSTQVHASPLGHWFSCSHLSQAVTPSPALGLSSSRRCLTCQSSEVASKPGSPGRQRSFDEVHPLHSSWIEPVSSLQGLAHQGWHAPTGHAINHLLRHIL